MIDFLFFLIKATLLALILMALIQAMITHIILVYELRLSHWADEEKNDPIAWSLVLKSFLIEFGCNLAHLLLMPFANLHYPSEPIEPYSEPPKDLPILLVHGYLHNQTDWLWFRQKLQQYQGIGPIYSLNLAPPFNSIAALAENLSDKIKEVQANTLAPSIILIGHSMGGLVASYYSEYLAPQGQIAKLISLASPFQGTRLSAFGIGKNVREMGPNSPLLAELTQRIQASSIPYYFVASKIDNLVIPWQAAIPLHHNTHTENILILPDHGHIRMLVSPVVIEKVSEWIGKSN